LSNVPLPPPVMTTTSPFAEKMSFGLIGVETSMVMKGWREYERCKKSDLTFTEEKTDFATPTWSNDCVTDGNKPLAKRSRGVLRVEFRLRWVSYEPADLVNAIPFELLLCQTS